MEQLRCDREGCTGTVDVQPLITEHWYRIEPMTDLAMLDQARGPWHFCSLRHVGEWAEMQRRKEHERREERRAQNRAAHEARAKGHG